MSQLLLHIGLPKTGSTAIQDFLQVNADRLASAGWNYPNFFRASNHIELAVGGSDDSDVRTHRLMQITEGDRLGAFRRDLATTMRSHTARSGDWVMTSEHLASRLTTVDRIERFAGLVEHFDSVRVLMYVRPQDEMAVASHSTWVVDGMYRHFDIDLHLSYENRYDFRSIAERWMGVFGNDAVEIRLYPGRDLLADLSSVMQLDPSVEWEIPPPANVSLTDVELAFLRDMNERLPRWRGDQPDRSHGDFHRAIAGSGHGERLRIDDADRRKILERFGASNAWILERAANRDGRSDYFDPPSGNARGNINRVIEAEEALEFAAALWREAGSLRRTLSQSQRSRRNLTDQLDALRADRSAPDS